MTYTNTIPTDIAASWIDTIVYPCIDQVVHQYRWLYWGWCIESPTTLTISLTSLEEHPQSLSSYPCCRSVSPNVMLYVSYHGDTMSQMVLILLVIPYIHIEIWRNVWEQYVPSDYHIYTLTSISIRIVIHGINHDGTHDQMMYNIVTEAGGFLGVAGRYTLTHTYRTEA